MVVLFLFLFCVGPKKCVLYVNNKKKLTAPSINPLMQYPTPLDPKRGELGQVETEKGKTHKRGSLLL